MASQQTVKAKIRRWGFTITELLVASVSAGIFLAGSAGIVIRTMQADRRESARLETQSELQSALDYIRREVAEAVYIYSDVATVTGSGATLSITNGSNGIPDLNERLVSGGYIPTSTDSNPVIAFWKLEPLPSSCFTGTNSLLPAATSYNLTRNVYVLVVYYLSANTAPLSVNPTWLGPAKIIRFELTPLDSTTCTRETRYPVDPTPPDFLTSFPALSPAPSGTFPPRFTLVSSVSLPDYIRPGVTAASYTFSGASLQDPPPACPANYSYGASNPRASFYACVSNRNVLTVPQDAIIYLQGNALFRADQGIRSRWLSNGSIPELRSYLINLQTQVFSRGVYGR